MARKFITEKIRQEWRICFVFAVHLIFCVYGVCWTINDIKEEQYPLSNYEIAYVCVFYGTHLFVLYKYFMGICNDNPLLFVPWLFLSFLIFILASLLTWNNIADTMFTYNLINFATLAIFWYFWYAVFDKFLGTARSISRDTGYWKILKSSII